MKVNRVEPILKSRITIFFDYLYIRQSGMTDDQILSELPKHLRRQIANRSLGLLSGVPFFKPDIRPNEFLNTVVDTLYGRVYLPDQWLIKAQESKRELLILREGEAYVMHNGVQLAAVTVGDYFGDYQCVLGGKYPVGLRAGAGFVETLVLSYEALKRTVRRFAPKEDDIDAGTPSKSKSKKNVKEAPAGPTVSMLDTDAGIVETKRLYRETIASWGAASGAMPPPRSSAATMGALQGEDKVPSKPAAAWGAGNGGSPATTTKQVSLNAQVANRRSRSTIVSSHNGVAASDSAVVPLPSLDIGTSDDNAMLMEGVGQSGLVVLPGSYGRFAWDIFLFFALMYSCLVPQLRLFRQYREGRLTPHYIKNRGWLSGMEPSLLLDYFIDVCFDVDMILRLFFFAVNTVVDGRDLLLVERSAITAHHMEHKRFRIDFIACVPVDLLGLIVGRWSYLRVPHVIRFWNIKHYVMIISEFIEEYYVLSPNTIRAAIMTCQLIFIILTISSVCGMTDTAIAGDNLTGNMLYLIHDSLAALMTVDYAAVVDTAVASKFQTLILNLILVSYFTTVVSNFSMMIRFVDLTEENTTHKSNVLNAFLRTNSVSHDLRNRINFYIDFLAEERDGTDEMAMLNKRLPLNLRQDLIASMLEPAFRKSPTLHDQDHLFLYELIVRMELHFFGIDEEIVEYTLPAAGLYIIQVGKVEITVGSYHAKMLKTNDSFCEEALLSHITYCKYSATTKEVTETWHLQHHRFAELLFHFPAVRYNLRELQKRPVRYEIDREAGIVKIIEDGKTTDVHGEKKSTSKLTQLIQRTTRRNMEMSNDELQAIKKGAEQLKLTASRYKNAGTLGHAWNTAVLFFVMWNIAAVPFNIVFREGHAISVLDWLPYYVGDIVLILDALIWHSHCVTYFWSHSKKYRSGVAAPCSILAALPLDLMFFAVSGKNLGGAQRLAICRLNKMLRAADAPSLVSAFEMAVEHCGLKVSEDARNVTVLITGFLLTAHLSATGFFWCSNSVHLQGNSNTWAYQSGLLRECSLGGLDGCDGTVKEAQLGNDKKFSSDGITDAYTAALLWAFGTLTARDQNFAATGDREFRFSIFALLLATGFYALIVAIVEDALSQTGLSRSFYLRKVNKATQYCDQQHLPGDLRRAILAYYERLWVQQRGIGGSEVLEMLPMNLRADFVLEISGDMIAGLHGVKPYTSTLVAELVKRVGFEFYMPQDFLFKDGECATTVFCVTDGRIDLVGSDQVVQAKLKYSSKERIKLKIQKDKSSKATAKAQDNIILGEGEFFERMLYSISVQASHTTHTIQLTYEAFESSLELTMLIGEYRAYMAKEGPKLAQLRTGNRYIEGIGSGGKSVKKRSKKKPLVLMPNDKIRVLWLTISMLGCLWYATTVPFLVAFARSDSMDGTKGLPMTCSLIDAFLFIFFIVDIPLHLKMFATRWEGQVVIAPAEFRSIYVRNSLIYDLLSLLPLANLGHVAGWDRSTCVLLRLVQLSRLRHATTYVDDIIRLMVEELKVKFLGMAGVGKALQMFMLFCAMIHTVACMWFSLARMERTNGKQNWIDQFWIDGADSYDMKYQDIAYHGSWKFWYRASFTWAFATFTSFGDLGVDPVTRLERIYQIIVMIFGVLLSDVNLLAMLASIVELAALQAHKNHRRTICARKFMGRLDLDPELRRKVLDYFEYTDNELANLSEADFLKEINRSLTSAILYHFAHKKLCDSIKFGAFQEGIVASLVNLMEPYTAVPGERVLEAGRNDETYYILQVGRASAIDACGDAEAVPSGAILSNVEYLQAAKRVGVPKRKLTINVFRAKGLPSMGMFGATHPYVQAVVKTQTSFGVSYKQAGTSVRKFTRAPEYNEAFSVKIYKNTEEAEISLMHYRRGLSGQFMGRVSVNLMDKNSARRKWHKLLNDKDQPVGQIRLSAATEDLPPESIAKNAEVSIVADTFCHFYALDSKKQDDLKRYMKAMRLPLIKRLPEELRVSVAKKRERALAKARNLGRALKMGLIPNPNAGAGAGSPTAAATPAPPAKPAASPAAKAAAEAKQDDESNVVVEVLKDADKGAASSTVEVIKDGGDAKGDSPSKQAGGADGEAHDDEELDEDEPIIEQPDQEAEEINALASNMFKTIPGENLTLLGVSADTEAIVITQGALRSTMRQTITGRAGGGSLAGRASLINRAAGASTAAGAETGASPRRASNAGRIAPRTSMRHGIGQTIQRPASIVGVKHSADSHPQPRASMFAHRTRIEPIGEDNDDDHDGADASPAP